MSPMDAVSTSRICSFIEALLCILIMICGGGLLRVTDTERCKVTGANRSIVKNGDGLAFGYAAGFKSSGTAGEARMKEQLVALKQLSSAASRLLASYLILGKPLAIKSALDLYGHFILRPHLFLQVSDFVEELLLVDEFEFGRMLPFCCLLVGTLSRGGGGSGDSVDTAAPATPPAAAVADADAGAAPASAS
jgi:hypothetical protein